MPNLTPAQVIDLVQEPLTKRRVSGPMSKESRGYYVIASIDAPADPTKHVKIPTSEYDARVLRAASIVWAESGGKTDARCYNVNGPDGKPTCSPTPPAGPRGVDRGLWQWNSVAWPKIDDLAAFDPSTSTEIAYITSKGYTSFGPWSKSRGMDPNSAPSKLIRDTYESMLGRAVEEYVGTPINAIDVTDTVSNAAGGLFGWAEALGRLLSRLIDPAFWRRIGIGALGVVLVVVAVVLLARRAVTSTVASTLTGGASDALTKGSNS